PIYLFSRLSQVTMHRQRIPDGTLAYPAEQRIAHRVTSVGTERGRDARSLEAVILRYENGRLELFVGSAVSRAAQLLESGCHGARKPRLDKRFRHLLSKIVMVPHLSHPREETLERTKPCENTHIRREQMAFR